MLYKLQDAIDLQNAIYRPFSINRPLTKKSRVQRPLTKKTFKNSVSKGEDDGTQPFSPFFPQCFPFHTRVHIKGANFYICRLQMFSAWTIPKFYHLVMKEGMEGK